MANPTAAFSADPVPPREAILWSLGFMPLPFLKEGQKVRNVSRGAFYLSGRLCFSLSSRFI